MQTHKFIPYFVWVRNLVSRPMGAWDDQIEVDEIGEECKARGRD
jgi:hypothetical protein